VLDNHRSEPTESPGSQLPPATLEGWYVLHQLFRISWKDVKRLDPGRIARLDEELADLLAAWEDLPKGGWSAAYRVYGGRTDLMLIHFRPELEGLGEAERRLQLSGPGDYLELSHDYLSVVELGLYGVTLELAKEVGVGEVAAPSEEWTAALDLALEEQSRLPYVRRRLFPRQPDDMPYVCFYPMNKRRLAGQNWYSLSLERRSELMHDHGTVGRRYAGRISQVISGSIGLDDWEWAVTLFAGDPLDFKKVITEMRYDGASAEYADFGGFLVGRRMRCDEWHLLAGP